MILGEQANPAAPRPTRLVMRRNSAPRTGPYALPKRRSRLMTAAMVLASTTSAPVS